MADDGDDLLDYENEEPEEQEDIDPSVEEQLLKEDESSYLETGLSRHDEEAEETYEEEHHQSEYVVNQNEDRDAAEPEAPASAPVDETPADRIPAAYTEDTVPPNAIVKKPERMQNPKGQKRGGKTFQNTRGRGSRQQNRHSFNRQNGHMAPNRGHAPRHPGGQQFRPPPPQQFERFEETQHSDLRSKLGPRNPPEFQEQTQPDMRSRLGPRFPPRFEQHGPPNFRGDPGPRFPPHFEEPRRHDVRPGFPPHFDGQHQVRMVRGHEFPPPQESFPGFGQPECPRPSVNRVLINKNYRGTILTPLNGPAPPPGSTAPPFNAFALPPQQFNRPPPPPMMIRTNAPPPARHPHPPVFRAEGPPPFTGMPPLREGDIQITARFDDNVQLNPPWSGSVVTSRPPPVMHVRHPEPMPQHATSFSTPFHQPPPRPTFELDHLRQDDRIAGGFAFGRYPSFEELRVRENLQPIEDYRIERNPSFENLRLRDIVQVSEEITQWNQTRAPVNEWGVEGKPPQQETWDANAFEEERESERLPVQQRLGVKRKDGAQLGKGKKHSGKMDLRAALTRKREEETKSTGDPVEAERQRRLAEELNLDDEYMRKMEAQNRARKELMERRAKGLKAKQEPASNGNATSQPLEPTRNPNLREIPIHTSSHTVKVRGPVSQTNAPPVQSRLLVKTENSQVVPVRQSVYVPEQATKRLNPSAAVSSSSSVPAKKTRLCRFRVMKDKKGNIVRKIKVDEEGNELEIIHFVGGVPQPPVPVPKKTCKVTICGIHEQTPDDAVEDACKHFGEVRACLVFRLPGQPVSADVTFAESESAGQFLSYFNNRKLDKSVVTVKYK